MNGVIKYFYCIFVVFCSFKALAVEHVFQTGNSRTFYLSPASEIFEAVINTRGDIVTSRLVDTSFKKDRIVKILPYADEKMIIFAVVRADPTIGKIYLKESADARPKNIGADIVSNSSQGLQVRSMSIVGDKLYLLTNDGNLWEKDLTTSSSTKMITDNSLARFDQMFAVGKYLVLYDGVGDIFSANTDAFAVDNIGLKKIGDRWGKNAEFVALNDREFIVKSSIFKNLQIKKAEVIANPKTLSKLEQGLVLDNKRRLFYKNGLFIVDFQTALASPSRMKVLTYNVCWECMTNSKTGSAKRLGQQCTYKTVNNIANTQIDATICAENMAKAIDEFDDYYGGNEAGYDFIGLQEAADWEKLKDLSHSLSKMTAVEMRTSIQQFVSFYNQDKYDLEKEINGALVDERKNAGGKIEQHADRLFQILIFKQPVIFVNVHNGHGDAFSRMVVERKISAALKKVLTSDEIEAKKNHRVIIVGDFNDHKNYFWPDQFKYGLSYVPFRYADLLTPVFFLAEPQGTCCSTKIPFGAKNLRVSDFILDSEKIAPLSIVEVPRNYDYASPKSDHLPVIFFKP